MSSYIIPDLSGRASPARERMTDEYPEEIIQVIGKEYSPEILAATSEPKSVEELSEEINIPIATCYRRVDELENCGLLECESQQSEANREIKSYRRTVDGVVYNFRDSLSITKDNGSGIKQKILWAVNRIRSKN